MGGSLKNPIFRGSGGGWGGGGWGGVMKNQYRGGIAQIGGAWTFCKF